MAYIDINLKQNDSDKAKDIYHFIDTGKYMHACIIDDML